MSRHTLKTRCERAKPLLLTDSQPLEVGNLQFPLQKVIRRWLLNIPEKNSPSRQAEMQPARHPRVLARLCLLFLATLVIRIRAGGGGVGSGYPPPGDLATPYSMVTPLTRRMGATVVKWMCLICEMESDRIRALSCTLPFHPSSSPTKKRKERKRRCGFPVPVSTTTNDANAPACAFSCYGTALVWPSPYCGKRMNGNDCNHLMLRLRLSLPCLLRFSATFSCVSKLVACVSLMLSAH